jgi:hypothetical protein
MKAAVFGSTSPAKEAANLTLSRNTDSRALGLAKIEAALARRAVDWRSAY